MAFWQFLECSAPGTNAKPPLLKLSSNGSESPAYSSFAHKKRNLTHTKQEFKYLRAQWHDQTKIRDQSQCLILDEQQYFV